MTKANHYASEGSRSITPHLVVKGAKQAIEYYKKAFGAKERGVMAGPDGMVMHAELQIGDSVFYLNDENIERGAKSPQALGGTPVTINLYVPDCDVIYKQALAAGATVKMPLEDQFWGDRYGQVADPFGHVWSIATHKEDLTEAEIWERAKKAMAPTGQG